MGTVLPFVPPLKRLAETELRTVPGRLIGGALAHLSLLERLFLSTRVGKVAR